MIKNSEVISALVEKSQDKENRTLLSDNGLSAECFLYRKVPVFVPIVASTLLVR